MLGTLHRDGEKIFYNMPNFLKLKRNDLYFAHEKKNIFKNQFKIIDKLNSINCRYLGLDSSETEFEYLIWLIIDKLDYNDKILFHLNAKNLTNLKSKNYNPCAVFLLDKLDKKNKKYKKIFKNKINSNEFIFYY